MRDSTHDRVFLVGFMGSGKTAVGRVLAARRGLPFFDTDAWIEGREDRSVAEIFRAAGEARFRELEGAALEEACRLPSAVIATGGGLFVSAPLRDRIRESGVSVWLDTPLARIWERCRPEAGRPLFGTWEELEALLGSRRTSYALADWRVEVGDRTVEAVAEEIGRLVASPRRDEIGR